ncbi:MAG: YraN family protein [Betaproteobacteria bacterium]|nr:YraN family protein [Betaproteobacteria bacterium]
MSPGNRGAEAEQLAAKFLQRQGLRLVETNYRCRFGEIDLICRDRDVLVFVEVRLREGEAFGGAAASITERKQHKIVLAARHYLQRQTALPACRFDVVLLRGLRDNDIEWIRNAFGE